MAITKAASTAADGALTAFEQWQDLKYSNRASTGIAHPNRIAHGSIYTGEYRSIKHWHESTNSGAIISMGCINSMASIHSVASSGKTATTAAWRQQQLARQLARTDSMASISSGASNNGIASINGRRASTAWRAPTAAGTAAWRALIFQSFITSYILRLFHR